MGINNRSKSRTLNIHHQQTSEQKMLKLKESFFTLINAHLAQNQNASSVLYYFCLLLEHLALLWFVLHPGLGIFGEVYLLSQLRLALQILNFQEYLQQGQQTYQTMIGIILAYLVIQIVIIAISCYNILNKSTGEFAKYIKKIANLQLIFNVKVLSGPIFAVLINVFYCQDASPYKVGVVCYDSVHIVFCVISTIIAVLILTQVLLLGTFYFIKNPLSTSYLGNYNRYYILSKAIIKIMLPVYFAVDYSQSLAIVYVFLVTALLGLYIFWHRLFSIHAYQQQHFYVEYFMQAMIFWMAANNILSYYIQGANTTQKMSLIYALFSAVLIAILLMNIQKTAENQFIQECLQKKAKKQNMERFVFILINRFLHETSKQAKLTFKVYSKIISKNIERYKQIQEKLYESHNRSQKEDVYHFLCILIQSYLQENNSVILKTLKCYLLCYLGQKSYGLHQSLELQEQRLGLADEFMLFEFRMNQNVFSGERVEKMSLEFVKYYRFHQQLGELQELIQLCAQNNAQYWDELCQADPSIAKLRNLATFYDKYYSKIATQYGKVITVFPQNLYSTHLYLKFLMNIGVDTKETLKVKEKLTTILETKSRSVRVSECQLNEEENIAIVTLNSIGNNLGVVLNCNNAVQETLGFDKNGLIGKNVTKIMPKIYSQLHNNFILKFIRSETSHLRPSDKLVTALSKDSLLVEINLTVRMMTSTQNALVIVGFMRKVIKQPEDKEKGLLMFSLNTSEILGIDAQFQKLMNYKLSGKQLAQEQVKLASIMPQLNLELLQKEAAAKTVLEVGNATQQDDMDMDVTKYIKVQLRSTKFYEGITIGFMTISEEKTRERTFNTLTPAQSATPNFNKFIAPEILSLISKKKENQKPAETTDEVSISCQERLVHGDDGLMQELPMAKKLEEYIQNKQNNKIKSLINVIHVITILGCGILAAFIYFSHGKNGNHMMQMYNQMNTTTSMPYYIGRINLLTSLLWSSQTSAPQLNYSSWLPVLSQDYQAIKTTLYSLVTFTKQYGQDLEYNTFKNYLFKYIASVNGNLVKLNLTSNSINFFNSYLQSASVFLYTDLTSILRRELLQIQSLFIRLNGDEIIPDIATNGVKLYESFLHAFINAEFTRMSYLKAIMLVLSVVTMALIAAIGNHINKINKQVVQIYKKIKLWDINELSIKCNNFLGARGLKINKKRSSSLLRIFPIKTLLEIIDPKKQKKSAFMQESRNKRSMQQSIAFREVMSPDPLITPALMSPAQNVGAIDYEETLLKGNELQPTVQIYWQSNNKLIIVGMVIIFLIIGGVIAISIVTLSNNANQLNNQVKMLQQIGEVRKILNFISYFSWRIIENPNNSSVRVLLNKYISAFYEFSGLTYPYLGDPQPVLKNVYTYVETIQQWLAKPNISSTNILLANYASIYHGLKQGSDQIQQLNIDIYQPQYKSSIESDQQTQLIFAIVLFLVNCFFILVLDCMYLKPIYRQSQHSVNMIKILPAWVFQRNSDAFDYLAE